MNSRPSIQCGPRFTARLICIPSASGLFFQGEGGIRSRNVTGVQTCALPIAGRDVLGELFAAARQRGTVKGAVHYSMGEWFSPAPNPDLPIDDPQNLVTYLALARWGTWRPRNAYTLERVPYTGYVPIADYGRDHVYAQLTEIIDR